MTTNNYPEGLDELAREVAKPFITNTQYLPFHKFRHYARSLLDALAKRGYVLVDAKKQEPVATLHDDGCFTWKRDELRILYDRERAGWRIDVYASHPAIPGRVALPDGWKLVPVEPTMAMLDAAHSNFRNDIEIDPLLKTSYRAMLSAAPTPPTQPQGDGSLRRDAERYRWLAKTSNNNPAYNDVWACWPGGDLGEAVDAAMEASNG